MTHPPRLAHLAKRSFVVDVLAPTYAASHRLDPEEARIVLDRALRGRLLDDLLDACWEALRTRVKRFDADKTLERIADGLAKKPVRRGRVAEVDQAWSAFLVLVGIEAGTAGVAATRVFETDRGREMAEKGLAAAGRFLAEELLR